MAFTATHTKINWRTFFYCFFLAFGSLSYGYNASIISTTFGQPVFLMYMGLMDAAGNLSSNSSALEGTAVGLFCAGGCLGVLSSSWSLDKFGRKFTLAAYATLLIIGNVISTAAQDMGMFIFGRFIVGVGCISCIAICPVYVVELAQAEIRGALVGMTGVAIAIGYSAAAYMGLAFSYAKDPEVQWRTPLGLALVLPSVVLVALLFIPESPRFLLLKNKPELAWRILNNLHRDRTGDNEKFIKEEFFQMQKQIEYDSTLDCSWLQMFRKPSYRKRILMVSGINFLAQSTAVLVVANYGPSFYASLGFNVKDSLILQCGWITGSIPASILAICLVDRFGRKPFMLTGFVGCLISLCVLAPIIAIYAPSGTNKVGLGWGVTALYLVVIFYCLGVEACGSIFYSEIFPTHTRAKGVCFAVFINSLINLVYLMAAPTALKNIGWKFLLLFICILTIGTVLFWIYIPETKSVPIEEIAAIFGDADEVKVYSADIHIVDSKEAGIEVYQSSKDSGRKMSKEIHASELEESISAVV